MSYRTLFNKFASVSFYNILLSAFNLGSTVLLVRWFGAAQYASYTLDSAMIALITILLEIVPSSYSVFRVQDDSEYINGVAGVSLLSGILIAAILTVAAMLGLFQSFSYFIICYGVLIAVKRYLDIRLQSTGRLKEFYQIETISAGLRIALMGAGVLLGVSINHVIWGSLALAYFVAQLFWFVRNREEFNPFKLVLSPLSWQPLISERSKYLPYYLGIVLKRLRDNLMPLLAGVFFETKEMMGVFFLAYRGLAFTCGQIRVVEGLLNHRTTLDTVMKLPLVKHSLIAFLCQIICFASSVILAVVSGVKDLQLATVLILSFVVWSYVFLILIRADAYSKYKLTAINMSLITFIIVMFFLTYFFKIINFTSINIFACIILVSEIAALLFMVFNQRKKNEKSAEMV